MTTGLCIELRDVSVRRGAHWALREVSLRLEAGGRWALIGGNGAGKTQLLKMLAGLVWPTPTGREARSYLERGRELDLTVAQPRIAYVGSELQDKYARYEWNLTIEDLLVTGLHHTDLLLEPATARERRQVAAMLETCALVSLRRRRFLSLSYGQKRLALLARALIQRPDWLLLDEFYNGLDSRFRARMDRVLRVARARGQSWVAAAHRAVDVPAGTQGLIELRAGRLHARRQLTRADLSRLTRDAGEAAQAARPRLPLPLAPARAAGRLRVGDAPLLRIAHADLFVDYRPVLRDLNWELRRGEHWAVFGANGAGKSSFLKLLYGDLLPAAGGLIERRGIVPGTPIGVWKRRVGFVSAELQTLYAVDVSVRDLVASGRHASIGLCEPPTAADRRHARRWLEFFALSALAECRPRELSYGQLRRALIARSLAGGARLMLLDEPLTGLDPRQRAAMKHLFERLMKRGITLVIAVHHAEDLPRGMTHALRLHKRCATLVDVDSAT